MAAKTKVCRQCGATHRLSDFITSRGKEAPSCSSCRSIYLNNKKVAADIQTRSKARVSCHNCGELRPLSGPCPVCGEVL